MDDQPEAQRDGGGRQPSEVAQIPPCEMFDWPLQRGEFASASREMAQYPGLDLSRVAGGGRAVRGADYLTECIYYLVLESQPPHKTVNLIFQLVIVKNKLTILWGS